MSFISTSSRGVMHIFGFQLNVLIASIPHYGIICVMFCFVDAFLNVMCFYNDNNLTNLEPPPIGDH